jgi:hydrocephalus-inducing protein
MINNYKNFRVSNHTDLPKVISFANESLPNCIVSVDRPIFKAEPSNITIAGFEPFRTYEMVINFRNSDQIARKIRVEQSDNPYFSVSGWKKKGLQSEKVAPGMETQYIVKFSPEEDVDYYLELVCVTERETFTVPIKAFGIASD